MFEYGTNKYSDDDMDQLNHIFDGIFDKYTTIHTISKFLEWKFSDNELLTHFTNCTSLSDLVILFGDKHFPEKMIMCMIIPVDNLKMFKHMEHEINLFSKHEIMKTIVYYDCRAIFEYLYLTGFCDSDYIFNMLITCDMIMSSRTRIYFAEYLLAKGVDPIPYSQYLITICANSGSCAISLLQILLSCGIDININKGYLVKNSLDKEYDFLEFVLKNGADISYLSVDDLILAVNTTSLRVIQLLMQYGVNFTLLNNFPDKGSIAKNAINQLLVKSGVDPIIIANISHISGGAANLIS